jgi:ribosomal protein S18 acetylase RimI-like enzyme
VDIHILSWDELDLHELATATYAIKRGEMSASGDQAVARIERWLEDEFATLRRLAVLARSGPDLVGWLMLVVQNRAKVEINPWFLGGHPLVVPSHEWKEVGVRLLDEAIGWCKGEEFETLELCITRQPGEDDRLYDEYHAWYGSFGFGIREESVGMICTLAGQTDADLPIPPDLRLVPILEVDQDELYRCYCETFKAGQSRFFFDQSEKERREYFATFGKTYGLHGDTSLALVKEGRIVGFSYTIPIGEAHMHLDWMGIHPNYRRQGLGEFLLRLIQKRAAQDGMGTLSLSSDVGNTRAIALYRKTSLIEQEGEIKYALKLHTPGPDR